MKPSEKPKLPALSLHGIGESLAQLKSSLELVKFPLFLGVSVPAHMPALYKSA